MWRFVVVAVGFVAVGALAAPPTPAQSVKYRHEVMEAAGGYMGALAMIVKGESDRAQDAALHANALRDLALTMGGLFPAGSGPAPGLETDAKPEIWSQADKFAAAVKKMETEATKLAEVAKGGDLAAIKAQFGAVGGACGDCHDAYKVDEDHH
jgi:cytochrome c556